MRWFVLAAAVSTSFGASAGRSSEVRMAVMETLSADMYAPGSRIAARLTFDADPLFLSQLTNDPLRYTAQPIWFHEALESVWANGRYSEVNDALVDELMRAGGEQAGWRRGFVALASEIWVKLCVLPLRDLEQGASVPCVKRGSQFVLSDTSSHAVLRFILNIMKRNRESSPRPERPSLEYVGTRFRPPLMRTAPQMVKEVVYAAFAVDPLVSLASLQALIESHQLAASELELAGIYQDALDLTAAPLWFNQVVMDGRRGSEPVNVRLVRSMLPATETEQQLQLRISMWNMFCIEPMMSREPDGSLPCNLRGGQMLMSEAAMRNMFAYLYSRAKSTKTPQSARSDDTFKDELDRKRFRSSDT